MTSIRPLLPVAAVCSVVLAPPAQADGVLAPATSAVVASDAGVVYLQYDGTFAGQTSTGAYVVPYRITVPAPPARRSGAVVVEPPNAAFSAGGLEQFLGRRFLLERGFAHAAVGWSTASFGEGLDLRILDPGTDGVFVDGGFSEANGRTDDEIVADFARALTADRRAREMLGHVGRRYLTGFSDSAHPVLRLLSSGRATGAFDFVLPFLAEGPDPQTALAVGRFDGKVIVLSSEAEAAAPGLVDSGGLPSRYRHYAVPGTPHVPDFLGFPSFTSMSTPASFEPELRAHFLQGHAWVTASRPPPSSTRWKAASDGTLLGDRNGNALSVDTAGRLAPRLPFLELGEARFKSGFAGRDERVRTIAALGFASHAAYLKAFARKLSDYRRAGSILAGDASAMLRRAALCPPLTFTETYRRHYTEFVDIHPCRRSRQARGAASRRR